MAERPTATGMMLAPILRVARPLLRWAVPTVQSALQSRQRLCRKGWPSCVGAARQLNRAAGIIAGSVLIDSAMEYYRGDLQNPAMVTPLVSAAASLAVSIRGLTDARAAAHGMRDATSIAAGALGFVGTAFHLYNVGKRVGGSSWQNRYAAPLGASMSDVPLSPRSTLQAIVKELLVSGLDEATIREVLDELRLNVHAHDVSAAYAAAALHSQTREYGRGLGDRSCMALALQLGVPALTAGREWKKVKVEGLKVEHLR